LNFCVSLLVISTWILATGCWTFATCAKSKQKEKKKEEGDVTFSWIFQGGTEPHQSEPLGVMF
jgi:hypothetical protein